MSDREILREVIWDIIQDPSVDPEKGREWTSLYYLLIDPLSPIDVTSDMVSTALQLKAQKYSSD